MEITQRAVGDITVLEVQGRLTAGTAVLTEQIDAACDTGSNHVLVQAASCSDWEEPELNALIAARTRAMQRGGNLSLVASTTFAQYAARRLGNWLVVSACEGDGIRSLWPARYPHTRMVGYWSLREYVSKYPDPHQLVAPDWRPQQRRRIIRYLAAGDAHGVYGGLSPCRFCGRANGSSERTDGTWRWPEGLTHYISAHAVRLPEEFVEAMEFNGWKIPASGERACAQPDAEFWVLWAARQGLVPAPYGQCLTQAERLRAALAGAQIERLRSLCADDARRLRLLLNVASALGGRSSQPSPEEARDVVSAALPVIERL